MDEMPFFCGLEPSAIFHSVHHRHDTADEDRSSHSVPTRQLTRFSPLLAAHRNAEEFRCSHLVHVSAAEECLRE